MYNIKYIFQQESTILKALLINVLNFVGNLIKNTTSNTSSGFTSCRYTYWYKIIVDRL